MKPVAIYIWLLLGVSRAVWGSNSCSYYYNIPKSSGATCESQGGVDRDLEEKIWKLEGGIEGIKVIGKANMNFVTTVQNTAGQVQSSQQMSDLNALQKQIDGLKTIFKSLPTGNQHPRAAKPTLQKEAAELSMAEWKLINVSLEFKANQRSRSIVMSTIELKLQAQEKKLTDLLNKIAILETKIMSQVSHHRGKRAATPSSQDVVITNMTNQAIDLRVDVRSIGKNEQKKLTDLTKTIDGLKKPVTDAKADLKNLTSSLNGVATRLMKVSSDAKKLQQTAQNVYGNVKPKLDQVQKEYRNLSEQLRNATIDYSTALNDLAQKSNDVKQNTKDVAKLKADYIKFTNDLSYLHMNVTVQHTDMVKLEKNPIVLIGKVDFDVKTFLLKADKSLAQVQRVLPVLQKRIKLLGGKPTTIPSG